MSISQASGANSLLRELKKEKTLLNLLSMSTIELLIFKCWNRVSISNDNLWEILKKDYLVFRRDLKIWLYCYDLKSLGLDKRTTLVFE